MGLLDENPSNVPQENCKKCKGGKLQIGKRYIWCDNPKCKFRYEIQNTYGEKLPSHWHPQARQNASQGKERFIPLRSITPKKRVHDFKMKNYANKKDS